MTHRFHLSNKITYYIEDEDVNINLNKMKIKRAVKSS